MSKTRHPKAPKGKNRNSYFYYYTRPIKYKGVDIWRSKHFKTGLITFYVAETRTEYKTLDAAKKGINAWEHKQYTQDKRKF